MYKWMLWQYKDVMDSFFAQCDSPTTIKAYEQLDLLRQHGNDLQRPACSVLKKTNGLYELRPKKYRLIFYFELEKKRAVFVCVHKKSEPKKVRDRIYKQAQGIRNKILLGEVELNVVH